MKIKNLLFSLILIPISCLAQSTGDYAIQGIPFNDVSINDRFWLPKIEINRTITIPSSFKKCEETGRIENFVLAAKKTGKFLTTFPFDDTDIYKIIEGASFSMSVHPDPALDKYVDSLINLVAQAQEPDGYLYTARTIDPKHTHEWSGNERWVNESVLSHELYNSGHLFEAAAAHYQATGKRNLLDIALKNANLLDQVFGLGKRNDAPGHEIVEMGLVKLYRITGEKKYLDLAKFFIDCRGKENDPKKAYSQDYKPLIQQDEAVGHAVRAGYLYSGVADVAALTGNAEYLSAIDKIWDNMVSKKLYITGGIGSRHQGEAFGDNYELPNLTAYNETCAAIANVYWNYRMFLLHGDSKYMDVLERSLYNGVISGVGFDGKTFFYPNPLECDAHFEFNRGSLSRQPWFDCSCCPTNLCRFLPSIPGYIYARDKSAIYLNLYIQNEAEIDFNGSKTQIIQTTDYPWNGKITVTVNPSATKDFSVAMRIPGWAIGQVVPGDLYHFLPDENAPFTITLNGTPVKYGMKNGYAVITTSWKTGDKIELNLPMPVKKVIANPLVAADHDKVALQRGPIVYCLEWPDNKDGHVLNLVLDSESKLEASFKPEFLNGVEVITGQATSEIQTEEGIQSAGSESFTAIPYYTWANRGVGEMQVWMALKADASRPLQMSTLSSKSKISSSTPNSTLNVINDNNLPHNSNDQDLLHYDCLPKTNSTEWIQYDFNEKTSVSESSVYWFDDGPSGGCRIPKSWRILYKSGNNWKPVKLKGEYPNAKDALNSVKFETVKTNAVRLEFVLPENFSAGIYEWSVK